MKFKLKIKSICEYGQRKDSLGNPHQEDSMYPAPDKVQDTDRLFILCDGMGGHDAGEVASATVCEVMSESVINDGHDREGIFTKEDFENALKAAHDALDEKDTGAEKKMGTTMTFLKFFNKGAFMAHMGDSRVYHIRPGKDGESTQILKQTKDHSLVNFLVETGELTPEEARTSKQKNVILRAMQPHMERRHKADVYQTSDILAGDYFYMCSDGMLEQQDMEDGTSLRNIFSKMGGPIEKKAEILKSVTEDNRDNHTAFIIEVVEVIKEENDDTRLTEKNSATQRTSRFMAIIEEEEDKSHNNTEEKTVKTGDAEESTKIKIETEEKVADEVKTDKESGELTETKAKSENLSADKGEDTREEVSAVKEADSREKSSGENIEENILREKEENRQEENKQEEKDREEETKIEEEEKKNIRALIKEGRNGRYFKYGIFFFLIVVLIVFFFIFSFGGNKKVNPVEDTQQEFVIPGPDNPNR